MTDYKYDLSVAIIFFCRPDTLSLVFEKVRNARPSRLFLIQDGPRANKPDDLENIIKCREIVENVDWNCEVYKNYSDVNLGCGMRPYSGISWVFENTESAVIVEDDCVPADSFFPFCSELLQRYKDDYRIGMISSWNHLISNDFNGCSYGFSKAAGCGAWATWRSRWQKCDFRLDSLNQYNISCLQRDITPNYVAKKKINRWIKAKEEIRSGENVSFWDHQWNYTRFANSWLSIVPAKNQMRNLGNIGGGTHFGKSLPKRILKTFDMKTPAIDFPLIHPKNIIVDRNYDDKVFGILYPKKIELLESKVKQIIFK